MVDAAESSWPDDQECFGFCQKEGAWQIRSSSRIAITRRQLPPDNVGRSQDHAIVPARIPAANLRHRLVYAVKSERVAQHNASVQVIADGENRCRLVWIVDVLPHAIAGYMAAQMDEAAKAMQRAFPGRSA